ncbi:hypothetical protein A5784_21645 [Mycobacterium sp. 852013-50091_SCH5140682]|nr:hypothetical protein A5784_21645 [Mycobacterium sp. 852013-50091_SCH5140682]
MDSALAQARRGRAAVLVLRGEAGIGKTALLQELVNDAPDVTVLRCAGIESEMELPFAGLHELCTSLLDGLDELPDQHAHAIRVALGLETGERPDRFQVGLGVLALLATSSERRPLLCIVEDAHWLDQVSVQALAFVGRRLLAERVALIFTAREPVAQPDRLLGLPGLRIGGLDQSAAGTVLDSAGGSRIDARVRSRIIAETHGNPLALLELGSRIGSGGYAGGFAVADQASLVERIESEYLARLAGLPSDTQQLMLLAAADSVGETALIGRAANTMGISLGAADAAVETGLLTIGALIVFRHPLLRSAVYRAADAESRRLAHGALANVLDPAIDPDRRAWHRAYAVRGRDEQAAAELIKSAGRAQARGGAAAAAAFWERAVALTPSPRLRTSRALVASRAKYAVGDLDGADRLLAEADFQDEVEQAEGELLRGQMAFTRHRGGVAPTILEGAAARFAALGHRTACEAYMQALIASSYGGPLGDAGVRERIARAALALPVDPEPVPARQLLVRGAATWMVNGYAAAATILKEAVRQYRSEPPDPGFVGFAITVVTMHLCDDEAWQAMAATQLDLARRSGMSIWLPFAVDALAEFLVLAGDLTQAAELMRDVDRLDPTIAAAVSPRIAMVIAASRGDAQAAEGLIRDMTYSATRRGEGWVLTNAEYARAVLYNGLADYVRAADAAEKASKCLGFEPAYTVRALFELAESAIRCDEHKRAREAAAQLRVIAEAAGTNFAWGMALRSQAVVTQDESAEGLYQEAIERLTKTRMAVHLARTRLSYGEWLRRRNRRIDARTQLRHAHTALDGIGANGFAERAHRELQATGERVRRGAAATSSELTPQEEQIAALARERRTNAEIGAQLFLSARTVEWHLRKVFAKLGIRTRRELDAALAARRL